MIQDKNLLEKKMAQGYTPCFNGGCSRHEHCLHWQGSEFVDPKRLVVQCVNPMMDGADCPVYAHDEKVHMGLGFNNLLDQLPRTISKALMDSVVNTVNRTYAYEHRNGTRPTPPWLQQHITDFCRQHGWQGPVEFDAYEDQYDW